MTINYQLFTKNILSLPEFAQKFNESDIKDAFFSEQFSLFYTFFETIGIKDIKEQISLAKRIYSIFLMNIISELPKISNEHDVHEYYSIMATLYDKYRVLSYDLDSPIPVEELSLHQSISQLYKSSELLVFYYIFSSFPSHINKIINDINSSGHQYNEDHPRLQNLQIYENTLKDLFLQKMKLGLKEQKKENDFFLLMQDKNQLTSYTSISDYIHEKFEPYKLIDSKNMNQDFHVSYENIKNGTIRTIISFPIKTEVFSRLYSDVYLHFEKFISPQNISFTYQYTPTTTDIEYNVSLRRKFTNNKSLDLVIDCEENFSPYLSQFFLQKLIELKTIFYNIHSDDIPKKSESFQDFAFNLMKEERAIYLEFIMSKLDLKEKTREKPKI